MDALHANLIIYGGRGGFGFGIFVGFFVGSGVLHPGLLWSV